MKKPIALSTQIRDARQLAGLTQHALAERIGINRSYLAKLELGVHDDPGLKLLLALAAVLNLDWFSGGLLPHVEARRAELNLKINRSKPAKVRKKSTPQKP